MSKIEVLRVPDERLDNDLNEGFPHGTLVWVRGKYEFPVAVLPDEQPALLAALLEDAGAVKVLIDEGTIAENYQWQIENGYAYILPVQDGGE